MCFGFRIVARWKLLGLGEFTEISFDRSQQIIQLVGLGPLGGAFLEINLGAVERLAGGKSIAEGEQNDRIVGFNLVGLVQKFKGATGKPFPGVLLGPD